MRALLVLIALAANPPTALSAQTEPAPPPPEPPPAGASQEGPAPSLDFDLLPPETAAAAPSAAFDREVARRKRMLRFHQGLGIATWSALAATVAVGQLDLHDRFRGGGDTGKWHGAHRALALGTSAMFLGTGLLGLFAPEPYAKKLRLDTATLHKASMALAAAGMVTQIVLGVAARRSGGELRERDLARAHQIVGYATLGAMTVGATVLVF